jgi:CBS domain containing-hemolysin-like protein
VTESGALGWWLATASLAIVVPGISALTALLERSGPIRLRHWAEEAGGRVALVYEVPARFEAFRFLVSILARLALLSLVLVMARALATALTPGRAAALALLGTTVLAASSELLNRALVGRDAERSLRRLTVVYRALVVVLLPLVVALAALMPLRRARRDEDEEEASQEEIEAFLDVGTREGILEPGEEEMVRGIVDFGETVVRSVMVPRIDIVAAPVDSTAEQLTRLFLEWKYARIPLYHESIDQIVGVLHLHGLLDALHGSKRSPRELAKPPVVVPMTKPLKELLAELQARGQQMAIVVDEHGGTAGIVTVEDLLEEIVGDIADEYDEVKVEKERLPDGAWLFAGNARVNDLEELLHVDLGDPQELPYETVGGLIMAAIGKVPRPGDRVEQQGLAFTVESVRGRRVERVRVDARAAEPVEVVEGAE